MIDAIIDRAGFFIAGGVTFSVIGLLAGYLVCKRLYRRAARGY